MPFASTSTNKTISKSAAQASAELELELLNQQIESAKVQVAEIKNYDKQLAERKEKLQEYEKVFSNFEIEIDKKRDEVIDLYNKHNEQIRKYNSESKTYE